MTVFSNREIATAIWIIVLFICSLFKKSIRRSYREVLNSFFKYKILVYIVVSIMYFYVILSLINCINHLNTSQIKDAIFWFIASGLILTANTFSSKDTKNIYEVIIKNNIKIIVLLEYIIATYTFSLIIELLLFPVILFIGLMAAVSEIDKEYIRVYRIFNSLQILIGLIIFGISIYSAIIDYKGLLGITSLVNVVLPIIYMILYFPFSYFWILFAKYEELFCVIKQLFKNKKSEELGRKLKKAIFKYCGFRYNRVNDIRSNKYYFWHFIQNEKEIEEFIYHNKNKIKKNTDG